MYSKYYLLIKFSANIIGCLSCNKWKLRKFYFYAINLLGVWKFQVDGTHFPKTIKSHIAVLGNFLYYNGSFKPYFCGWYKTKYMFWICIYKMLFLYSYWHVSMICKRRKNKRQSSSRTAGEWPAKYSAA